MNQDVIGSETEPCVHQACNCVVENPIGADGFCSEDCRSGADREDSQICPCGHPPCDTP